MLPAQRSHKNSSTHRQPGYPSEARPGLLAEAELCQGISKEDKTGSAHHGDEVAARGKNEPTCTCLLGHTNDPQSEIQLTARVRVTCTQHSLP